ncbi:MAG: hypothetical protein WD066_00985 [Planctomycetaceae bacterium]
MGEVPSPGVYEWPKTNPLLIDVVHRAGGLNESASGNIRIVRNGRGGLRAFYSPQLDFRLLPGDVVIAEAAPGAPSSPDAPVWLAFLDLLDRPVIVPMRPSDANVRFIVHSLKQPPEVAESVRVLAVNPRPDRAAATGGETLRTGSVLVFSRSALRPDRIPNNLPQPRRLDSELAGGERSPARPGAESHVARHAPRELAEVAGTAATPIADASRSASPVASSLPAMIGTPRNSAIAATTPPATSSGSPRGALGDESSESTEGVPRRAASGESSWAMTVAALLGGLGTLVGAVLWIVARRRRKRDFLVANSTRVPAEPVVEPPPRTRRRSLEDLISGELEVRERPVALPESFELHGRPTGHRTVRIDAAHAASADRGRVPRKARGTDHAAVAGALLRPHFLAKNRAAARSAAAAVNRPGPSREASRVELAMAAARNQAAIAQPAAPVVSSRRDAASRDDAQPIDPFQIGLLDRVLSTVHGAHRP